MPVDKSGRVFLVGSVPLLHPEVQTVEEMLEGWRNQQLCRNLDHDTIDGRSAGSPVHRYTNEFPWTWTPAIVEEFFADLRGIKRRRAVHDPRLSERACGCSAPTSPIPIRLGPVCEQRFGTHPAQVFFDWNTATHVQDNEQAPTKRRSPSRSCRTSSTTPTTRSPLIASTEAEGLAAGLPGRGDVQVAYSYGLRFNELRHLQTVDFARNPHAREFGRYGVVQGALRQGQERLSAQTPQRADGVRLDTGGHRRLARPRPALPRRRHRPVPQRARRAGRRDDPAAPIPALLQRSRVLRRAWICTRFAAPMPPT